MSVLVAATQQDNDRAAALDEIHPIAGTEFDPQFADAAEEFGIAEVAFTDPTQTHRDPCLRLTIPQVAKPAVKFSGAANFDHMWTVDYRRQTVNYNSQPLSDTFHLEMLMVDIAALGFRINSDGTVTATNRLDKMTDASRRAERGAHGLEGASNRMGGALARLAKVAAGLGATLAAAFTVRNMAQMVDTWSDLSSQVGVAVRNMELAGPVMDRLADVARASYSDLNSTAEAFSRNSRVLTEMGYSIQGALDYTEALNNALVATATRGQRAEQVQNALSKALATGKLEAEGLESILTHGGAVAEVLADKLSVTTNELYRLRAEGKITGQVIAEALIENFDKLRDQAEKMPATLGDGMQIIGNSILYVTGLFDKAGNLSEGVASRLVSLGDRIKDNADAIVGAMRLVATTAAAAAVVFATKYVFAVGVTMVKATVSAIAQQTACSPHTRG